MKQLIQSYRTGELILADVPAPGPGAGRLLVRTTRSVVSVGTERSMLDLARKSLLGKAMARPDLARQVIAKARAEGAAEAWRQSLGRLEDPVPLGYSSAGVVIDAGGASGFAAGDRVACSGSGLASHAEYISLPPTMAARIPDPVDDESAAFATVAAIALHTVRLGEATLGDRVAVIGLGLLGQLAVQILKAAGCRVLGLDVSPAAARSALENGADAAIALEGGDALETARAWSEGAGADAVLVFAAAATNQPIELAAALARERGRIVVPGMVGLDLPRKVFYEKELSLRISRAWGPGLYDEQYEKKGLDYPAGFVRWTAARNLSAALDLMQAGSLSLGKLLTHRFPIGEAVGAYQRILEGREPFVGVLLTYDEPADPSGDPRTIVAPGRTGPGLAEQAAAGQARWTARSEIRAGLLGAGLFAKGTLLPAMRGIEGLRLRAVATTSGASANAIARRLGLDYATTDVQRLLDDPGIDLVFILTRHGAHAPLAARALRAGKHVFVEKPLALDEEQLAELSEAHAASGRQLLTGFNRRFAPLTRDAIARLRAVPPPYVLNIRVNAGYAAPDSWVHDPIDGGGRIVGEACHFIDLAQALTGSLPVSVHATSVGATGAGVVAADNVALAFRMADGSLANVLYAAGGDKSFARERVEIFGGGAVCVIDNFRRLTWTQSGRRASAGHALSGVDRGHRAELEELVAALRSGRDVCLPFAEQAVTTRASFAAVESLARGETIRI